jgi:hypothetical protein
LVIAVLLVVVGPAGLLLEYTNILITSCSLIHNGCETWSLTLREKIRLRVFEKRVLRRVFGPKRDEVTSEWRKLHNEELNDLYSLPNIVRVVKSRLMRRVEHVARMREDRGVHMVLVGTSEGKRPLGRPRRRWEDNIKMDLQGVGDGVVETGWSWLRIGAGGEHLWVR